MSRSQQRETIAEIQLEPPLQHPEYEPLRAPTVPVETEATVQVERHENQPVLAETTIKHQRLEVQPLIERQREKAEIHPIMTRRKEVVEGPVEVIEKRVRPERREFMEEGSVPQVQWARPASMTVTGTNEVIVKPAVIKERVTRRIIEEIQPVIEREIHETRVYRTVKPIIEHVVENPVIVSAPVLTTETRRLESGAGGFTGRQERSYGRGGEFVYEPGQFSRQSSARTGGGLTGQRYRPTTTTLGESEESGLRSGGFGQSLQGGGQRGQKLGTGGEGYSGMQAHWSGTPIGVMPGRRV